MSVCCVQGKEKQSDYILGRLYDEHTKIMEKTNASDFKGVPSKLNSVFLFMVAFATMPSIISEVILLELMKNGEVDIICNVVDNTDWADHYGFLLTSSYMDNILALVNCFIYNMI